MSDLTDDIVDLVMDKREISLREIKDRLVISSATLATEIMFLMELGLVKLDKSKQFVYLRNPAKWKDIIR